jgi:hypothetical protein
VLASSPVRAATLALLALAAAAPPAAAAPYERLVDVEDQADLEDLRAAGDITQDTYDELLTLLEAGVDLSLADRAQLYALPNLTYDDVDRIIAYRDKHGGAIRDPAELVAAGVLTADELRAISAFLAVPADERRAGEPGVRGRIRVRSRFAVRDQVLPPLELRGRLAVPGHVQIGLAALLHRLEIGAPIFDPNRGALLADRRGYGAAVPKAFVKYESRGAVAVAGSFRAGFGQRLVFDDSRRATPNGLYADDEVTYAPDLELECRETQGELAASPCAGAAGGRYVTPDFRYREGLLGVGAGFRRRALGDGWLQAYAWASAARRSLGQDELVDRGRCPDPHDDRDPACAPPAVLVRPEGSILTATSRLEGVTLPRVFVERLAGVHLAYFADARNSVGLTAYGAAVSDLLDGIDLDTQEWSHLPTGRRFGAVGASFAIGTGGLDLAGEAALSVDRLPDGPGPQEGGGGPAAVVRATATRRRQELEASLRYYGVDFANPYARPISQPDELDGQRARDEAGARLRYAATGERLTLRAMADLWYAASSLGGDSPLGRTQPKLESYLRLDGSAGEGLGLGLFLRYQDQDLLASGHAQCFEDAAEAEAAGTARGEPIPCGGRRLTTVGSARLGEGGDATVTAMLEHRLLDDGLDPMSPFRDRFRHDIAGWIVALWRPDPGLRMRGRVRYLEQGINGGRDDYLERSVALLFDAALGIRARDVLRARADVTFWFDDREVTRARSPNPELQLWLSYEARL